MKKTAFLMASLIASAILFPISLLIENSRAADGTKFAIAYSGNVLGYFESCG